MKTVSVVDSICGSGKSTQVFSKIRKSDKDEKWLFVSPYLSEAGDGNKEGRIHKECPDKSFKSPKASGGKGQNLKQLIKDGHNVAITHALLLNLDEEALNCIEANEYNIVVDETLDVISIYEGQHKHDIRCMVGFWLLKDESTGKLSWNYELAGDNYNGHFKDVKSLCELGSLYIHKDGVLINRLSSKVMEMAKSVTILTYMFEGSLMRYWMDMDGVPWKKIPLETVRSPEEIKQDVRENLFIWKTPKGIYNLNFNSSDVFIRNAFSSSWLKDNEKCFETVRKGCRSFLNQLSDRGLKGEVMWTVFKDYEEDLATKGMKQGSIITDDGVRLTPFVSKSTRATNDHVDKNTAIYLPNIFVHGEIGSYLGSQNIKVDSNALAISEMVQWLFRGCIRKGEPMYLMVASERMKSLLEGWLEKPE